jgi:hypothetical protein
MLPRISFFFETPGHPNIFHHTPYLHNALRSRGKLYFNDGHVKPPPPLRACSAPSTYSLLFHLVVHVAPT